MHCHYSGRTISGCDVISVVSLWIQSHDILQFIGSVSALFNKLVHSLMMKTTATTMKMTSVV